MSLSDFVVPSAPPSNIMANLSDPTSILLFWDPPDPENKNGKIVRYAIDVTRKNTGKNFQLFTSQTSITIENLVPYTVYACMVAASTVAGVGPFSGIFTVTTNEDSKLI